MLEHERAASCSVLAELHGLLDMLPKCRRMSAVRAATAQPAPVTVGRWNGGVQELSPPLTVERPQIPGCAQTSAQRHNERAEPDGRRAGELVVPTRGQLDPLSIQNGVERALVSEPREFGCTSKGVDRVRADVGSKPGVVVDQEDAGVEEGRVRVETTLLPAHGHSRVLLARPPGRRLIAALGGLRAEGRARDCRQLTNRATGPRPDSAK